MLETYFSEEIQSQDDQFHENHLKNMSQSEWQQQFELDRKYDNQYNKPIREDDHLFQWTSQSSSDVCNSQTLRTFSESESLDLHSGLPFEELKLDFGDLNVPISHSERLSLDMENFDLAAFITEESPKKGSNLRVVNSGAQTKQEDVEEYVDVEGLSDNEDTPALAASNLNSLLEQFEATVEKVKLFTPTKKTMTPSKPQPVLGEIFDYCNEDDSSEKLTKDNINQLAQQSPFKTQNQSPSETVFLDHSYCFTESPKSNVSTPEKTPELKSFVIYGGNKSVARSSQSLLKPNVQRELKMASLLISPQRINKVISKVSPSKRVSKRKLNLEEYKLRRGSNVRSCENSRIGSPVDYVPDAPFSMPSSPVASFEEINVVSIKREQLLPQKVEIVPPIFDPIAKATRKALQMKRAANQKSADEQLILSKIPKMENLIILPMETSENGQLLPMVKELGKGDVKPQERQVERLVDPVYEEIVMVSVAVDTEHIENVKKEESIEQHGENKIIMHLKKNRVKPETSTIGTQTEPEEIVESVEIVEEFLVENNDSLISEEWSSMSIRRSRSRTRRIYRGNRRRNNEDINETTDSGRNSRSDSSSSSDSHSSRSLSNSSSSSSSSSSSCGSRSSSSSSSSSFSSRDSSRYSRSRSPHRRRRRSRKHSFRKSHSDGDMSKEQRRIIFVGKLEEDISRSELASKFSRFGSIINVTLHSKEDGTRYGFVTYAEAMQCYQAVDKASKESDLQKYDVSFGGRRTFCGQMYADLDNLGALQEEEYFLPPDARVVTSPVPKAVKKVTESSFDSLLQEMLKRKERCN